MPLCLKSVELEAGVEIVGQECVNLTLLVENRAAGGKRSLHQRSKFHWRRQIWRQCISQMQ